MPNLAKGRVRGLRYLLSKKLHIPEFNEYFYCFLFIPAYQIEQILLSSDLVNRCLLREGAETAENQAKNCPKSKNRQKRQKQFKWVNRQTQTRSGFALAHLIIAFAVVLASVLPG